MKMRRFHSSLSLLAVILMMMAGTACVETLNPDGNSKRFKLPIRIYLPMSDIPATKAPGDGNEAYPDSIRAHLDELTLHDLQVWMYTHQTAVAGATPGDAQGAVAYLCKTGIEDVTGDIEVEMPLPGYVLDYTGDQLRFDFYVLGNGRSAGFDLSDESLRNLTRGALRERLLSGVDTSGFGSRMVDTVPSTGLPMTCFFNNENKGFDLSFLKMGFTGNQLNSMRALDNHLYDESSEAVQDLNLTNAQKAYVEAHCVGSDGRWKGDTLCPQVTLVRSISRLRFVFAKTTGMTGTGITSIELADDNDQGVIPFSTFLFPRELMPESGIALPGDNYEKLAWGKSDEPLVSDADILSDDNPLRLRSSSNTVDPVAGKAPDAMNAQEYENFLTNWVGDHTSTQLLLYLRESDKPVQGVIHYQLGDKTGSAPFCMDSDPATNFHRNHAWTIYAYFSSSQLFLEISPDPWIGASGSGQHLKK